MARFPRFGLELPPLRRPEGPGRPAGATIALEALGRAAEAAGLGALWLVEGPAGGLDPVPVAGALAATTATLGIGLVVRPSGGRHPSVVARDLCALDRLSRGRALVALVEDRPAALDRLDEAARLLARLLREPAVTEAGRHYRVSGLTVRPRPLRPGGPPLAVGLVAGEAATEDVAAAAIADALVVSGTATDVARARRRLPAAGPALVWRGVLAPGRGTAQARSVLDAGADGVVAVVAPEAARGGSLFHRPAVLDALDALGPLAGAVG